MLSTSSSISHESISYNLQDSQRRTEISLPDAVHHRIFGRVHLFISDHVPDDEPSAPFGYLSFVDKIVYHQFCHDFGPMNLVMIFNFCKLLDNHIFLNFHRSTAIISKPSPEAVTNAAFLLGAYMIIRMGTSPEQAVGRLAPLKNAVVPYRDILTGESTMNLPVWDCLEALGRARDLGWVDFSESGFDPEEYTYFDNPLNADLHVVVPGKIISMRSPVELEGGALWQDFHSALGRFSHRDFSPAYYTDILQQFDVQAIVRLCMPRYATKTAAAAGTAVVDLPCDEGPVPPADAVLKFFAVVEGVPGAVALQGKVGLGRTGTLAALYLMKHHEFSALQAIAWTRIVRPGSILGDQQAYLVAMEPVMHRAGQMFHHRAPADSSNASVVPRDVVRRSCETTLNARVVGGIECSRAEKCEVPRPEVVASSLQQHVDELLRACDKACLQHSGIMADYEAVAAPTTAFSRFEQDLLGGGQFRSLNGGEGSSSFAPTVYEQHGRRARAWRAALYRDGGGSWTKLDNSTSGFDPFSRIASH